jgi:hypothetical protein
VKPVHGPVARVITDVCDPVDVHVPAHPLCRRQLRRGRERPVGDQPEQHPLGGRGVPRAAASRCPQPAQDRSDAEPVPQRVQHIRAAVRPRLAEYEFPVRGRSQRISRIQQPGQRRDQPAHRVLIQLVFPAEAVQQFRHRPAGGGVPLVMRQVQVADLAALDLPGRRLHVHRSRDYSGKPGRNDVSRVNRFSRGFQPRTHGSRH